MFKSDRFQKKRHKNLLNAEGGVPPLRVLIIGQFVWRDTMAYFTGTRTYVPPDVKYKYTIYLKSNMKSTIQDV